MKPFADLTVRGKARRLRQLALNALEHYDLEVARLRLLSNTWNGVFRVDTRDGARYVARINAPGARTDPEIRAELAWLAALRRDTALTVPEPLPNREDSLITSATAPGVPQARQCAVFRWVPGREIGNRWSGESMAKLGALMAQLHAHAAAFELPPDCALRPLNRVFPAPDPVVLFDPPFRDQIGAEDNAWIAQAIRISDSALERLPTTGARAVHNDLHGWNVKLHRGELCALDFEAMTWGYPIQDIGISLLHVLEPDYPPALIAAFRCGYQSLAPWPEQYPGELARWMMWRALNLTNEFIQSPNPAERVWVDDCLRLMRLHMDFALAEEP